jgi:hypothetical protein
MSSLVNRPAYNRMLMCLKAKPDVDVAYMKALAEIDRLRALIDYAPPVTVRARASSSRHRLLTAACTERTVGVGRALSSITSDRLCEVPTVCVPKMIASSNGSALIHQLFVCRFGTPDFKSALQFVSRPSQYRRACRGCGRVKAENELISRGDRCLCYDCSAVLAYGTEPDSPVKTLCEIQHLAIYINTKALLPLLNHCKPKVLSLCVRDVRGGEKTGRVLCGAVSNT